MRTASIALLLFAAGCSGGPSYWVTGDDDNGATLIVQGTLYTPGFTVTGVKELIRVPNNDPKGLEQLVGTAKTANVEAARAVEPAAAPVVEPEPEVEPEPDGE